MPPLILEPTSTSPISSTTEAAGSLPPAEAGTYGQILKSSALIGGSSAMNLAVGLVRTKCMAVFLGPAGYGLLSVYGSVATLAQTLAGMGLNSSGVRQIAEAAGSGESNRIAETTTVLRRVSLLLGILGAVSLLLFSHQVSRLTFGSTREAPAIAQLSLVVFFALISAGQVALIQGTRRIADLAKLGVAGAVLGTVVSVPLVYVLRERGVVPALIAVAAMTSLCSWWYSRKIRFEPPVMSTSAVAREAVILLRVGLAFMASALMTIGVAYLIRMTVLRMAGFEAAGLYQAAWTLGGLYVGFILQAMGADFYPRLTAKAKDHVTCNRLVNEQAHVGLLLAAPGILATLAFAPIAIPMLYSARFAAAVGILRWICLGSLIQVATWPMGFILVAKARLTMFVGCEIAWTVASLVLAWGCIARFGLNGVGIAFFASYVFHAGLIYSVVRTVSGFRWSAENRRVGMLLVLVIALVFGGHYILPIWADRLLGVVATLAVTLYSLRLLARLIASAELPAAVKRLLVQFHLVSAQPVVAMEVAP